jgi:DnaK suppressor protein
VAIVRPACLLGAGWINAARTLAGVLTSCYQTRLAFLLVGVVRLGRGVTAAWAGSFLVARGGIMAVDFQNKVAPYKPKKDEEYMNAKQLDHFRRILASVKSELSHDIDRTVQMMQDEATIFADPNDRASQESDMALELRNRDRERKLIKKIDETIARIDAGEYGYCDSCGIEIGLKRLEARPTATLCIDCKTLDEMRERQIAK